MAERGISGRVPRVSFAWLAAIVALVGLVVALAVACGPAGFQSETVVDSVRILATRVDNDKAYAQPGDTVTLEVLTADGRKTKPKPAVTYWLPFVCENPLNDLYYACFTSLVGGSDAGSDAGAGGGFGGVPFDAGAAGSKGIDITSFLPSGPYDLYVSPDIIDRHPLPKPGNPRYGLIVVFNIACAGNVWLVPLDPTAGPEQIPLVCRDDAGNDLTPNDYVIGFTRVYVSQAKTDLNPRIAGFSFDGTEYDAGGTSYLGGDAEAGSDLPAPINLSLKACDAGPCPAVKLDMDVTPSSWSLDAKKLIWVDYYAKGGSVGSDAKLLYDISAGRVSDTGHEVMYTPPATGPATLWAVVHDSNDGVTWLQVNITVH
jgi:hypothetical protein